MPEFAQKACQHFGLNLTFYLQPYSRYNFPRSVPENMASHNSMGKKDDNFTFKDDNAGNKTGYKKGRQRKNKRERNTYTSLLVVVTP